MFLRNIDYLPDRMVSSQEIVLSIVAAVGTYKPERICYQHKIYKNLCFERKVMLT
jgi:hypothetical protein